MWYVMFVKILWEIHLCVEIMPAYCLISVKEQIDFPLSAPLNMPKII